MKLMGVTLKMLKMISQKVLRGSQLSQVQQISYTLVFPELLIKRIYLVNYRFVVLEALMTGTLGAQVLPCKRRERKHKCKDDLLSVPLRALEDWVEFNLGRSNGAELKFTTQQVIRVNKMLESEKGRDIKACVAGGLI